MLSILAVEWIVASWHFSIIWKCWIRKWNTNCKDTSVTSCWSHYRYACKRSLLCKRILLSVLSHPEATTLDPYSAVNKFCKYLNSTFMITWQLLELKKFYFYFWHNFYFERLIWVVSTKGSSFQIPSCVSPKRCGGTSSEWGAVSGEKSNTWSN